MDALLRPSGVLARRRPTLCKARACPEDPRTFAKAETVWQTAAVPPRRLAQRGARSGRRRRLGSWPQDRCPTVPHGPDARIWAGVLYLAGEDTSSNSCGKIRPAGVPATRTRLNELRSRAGASARWHARCKVQSGHRGGADVDFVPGMPSVLTLSVGLDLKLACGGADLWPGGSSDRFDEHVAVVDVRNGQGQVLKRRPRDHYHAA